MSTRTTTFAVALLALSLAASGVAGTVTAQPDGSAATAQSDVYESPCAAAPPADLSDPASDVTGWENGYWYNESIAVDGSDGVNETELDSLINRTMARVEYVRCVEFNRTVPVSVLSRAEFRNQSAFFGNTSESLRTFDNAKFEALFLVNESADSIAVQNANTGSNVLGFYSPRTDEIVVISENRQRLGVDEITLAHELVHAYQDGQYNLTSPEFNARFRDQVNAVDSVVEGDASYVDTIYGKLCQRGDWQGTCVRQQAPAGGTLANFGVYLTKFFPYSDGPAFVQMVHQIGGWDAVDGLYRNLPASAEQVIHPQKYGTDRPANLTLEDTATANWSRVTVPDRPDYGRVGESALAAMFFYPYYHSQGQSNVVGPTEWLNFDKTGQTAALDPLDYELNYTAGWDGDRLHVYRRTADGSGGAVNGTDELAYVWRLAWDSPQDAVEFVRGYQQVLRYWGAEQVGPNTWVIEEGGFADAFHVSASGTNVTVVNAPTVEQLPEVRPGIAVPETATNETATNETASNGAATNETATNETASNGAAAAVAS